MRTKRLLKLIVLIGSVVLGYWVCVSSPPRSSLGRAAAIGYSWTSVKLAYKSKQRTAIAQAVERFLTVAKQNEPENPGLLGLAIVATVADATADETSGNAQEAQLVWEQASKLCKQARWETCSEAELRSTASKALGGGDQ